MTARPAMAVTPGVLLRACPKCKGAMRMEGDRSGDTSCMQCAHVVYAERPAATDTDLKQMRNLKMTFRRVA